MSFNDHLPFDLTVQLFKPNKDLRLDGIWTNDLPMTVAQCLNQQCKIFKCVYTVSITILILSKAID